MVFLFVQWSDWYHVEMSKDQHVTSDKAFLLSIELRHGEVEQIAKIYVYVLVVKAGHISELKQWKEKEKIPRADNVRNVKHYLLPSFSNLLIGPCEMVVISKM